VTARANLLVLPGAVRAQIFEHARQTPTAECCGLLIGAGISTVAVARIQPTRNVAAEPSRRFEIDPQEQFNLLRGLRGTAQRIVGHYHSHPQGVPAPSNFDLAMAHDPEAVWLIVGLTPEALGAFCCPDQAVGFVPVPITDKA